MIVFVTKKRRQHWFVVEDCKQGAKVVEFRQTGWRQTWRSSAEGVSLETFLNSARIYENFMERRLSKPNNENIDLIKKLMIR